MSCRNVAERIGYCLIHQSIISCLHTKSVRIIGLAFGALVGTASLPFPRSQLQSDLPTRAVKYI